MISTSYTELSSRTAKNRDKCGITRDAFFPMFENVSREQYDMLCNGDMTSGDPSGMRNGGWGGCEDPLQGSKPPIATMAFRWRL